MKSHRLLASSLLILATSFPASAGDMAMKVAEDWAAKWVSAYNAGDAQSIGAMFQDDGIFLPALTVQLKGREEIENALAARMRTGWTKETASINEAHALGDIIWVTGEYMVSGSGKMSGRQFGGFFSEVLVKDGDNWRAVLLTANAPPSKQ
jgi:uncharacterized protein (TIGR02246 family)